MLKITFGVVGLVGSLYAQQTVRVPDANWQFTIGSVSVIVATHQADPASFSGSAVTRSGPLPAFTAQILPATPPTPSFSFTWDKAFSFRGSIDPNLPNIPGLSEGFMYWGSLGPDGCAMTGSYGPSVSQAVGTWNALVTAGSYSSAVPPCGSITYTSTVTMNASSTLTCSASTLTAAFGYLLSGTNASGTISAAGRIAFDGKGGVAGSETLNVAGQVTRGRKYTATYTVDTDCSGQIVQAGGPITTLDFVITAQGKTLLLVQSDANASVGGTAFQ